MEGTIASPERADATIKPHHLLRFTKFPVEIKEQIYEHAMRNDGCFKLPLHVAPMAEIPSLPCICLTSKLERSIATLVLARNTVLRLSNNDRVTFTWWIEAIGIPKNKFMTAVERVQLVYSEDSIVENLLFASKLPLEITALRVTTDWLYPPTDAHVKAASNNQVLDTYGLRQIAGCKALTRLTFHIPDFILAYERLIIGCFDVDHVAEVCTEVFREANGSALSVEMLGAEQSGPRRSGIGKNCVKRSAWERVFKGLQCDKDEVLHRNFEASEWDMLYL